MKSMNGYGIQDDSVLKIDVDHVLFPRNANLPTIGSITDRFS